jgi:hypothetical protein
MAESQEPTWAKEYDWESFRLSENPRDRREIFEASKAYHRESPAAALETLKAGGEIFERYLQHLGFLHEDLDEICRNYENPGYKCYFIRQGKSGKKRRIEEPREFLMEAQRKLVPFFEKFPLTNNCMARKGFGIRDNAVRHSEAKYVLRIDISKCYPSVTANLVRKGIRHVEKYGWINAAEKLAGFCFIWKKDKDGKMVQVLPTGAPTSPILCNIALTPLDLEVQAIAEKHGYVYTRYIDDLHLSTTDDTRHWDLISEVSEAIERQGLRVNKRKTKWYTVGANDKVIITGVRIKQGCSVPREFTRTIRARLQNLAKEHKPIDSETQGCLAYIYSVDPERHNSLLEYYNRRLNYVPPE